MRKYLTTFGVSCVGISAAVLVLLASAAVSRAGIVIVSNSSNYKNNGSTAHNSNAFKAESFDTGNIGGPISFSQIQITLGLNFTGVNSANVYLYTANAGSGLPATSGILIGTVSGTGYGLDTVTFNSTGLAQSLAANSAYAIVIDTSGTGGISATGGAVGWEYAGYSSTPTPTTSGIGTFFDPGAWDYVSKTGWANTASGVTNQLRILDIEEVPEVPMTGVAMGLGALAIAASHTLRRKLCVAGNV